MQKKHCHLHNRRSYLHQCLPIQRWQYPLDKFQISWLQTIVIVVGILNDLDFDGGNFEWKSLAFGRLGIVTHGVVRQESHDDVCRELSSILCFCFVVRSRGSTKEQKGNKRTGNSRVSVELQGIATCTTFGSSGSINQIKIMDDQLWIYWFDRRFYAWIAGKKRLTIRK
jgi:hypothetical protein